MKMQEIKVKHVDKKYSILIGNNILKVLPNRIKSICPQAKKIAIFFDNGVPYKYKKIILGMGDFGFSTRILAEKVGSYLTFCSKEGTSGAPGHVSPELLNSVYRFREIRRRKDGSFK